MTKVVIATAVYPMRAPWLAAFSDGLAGLHARSDIEAVIALDGVHETTARTKLKSLVNTTAVHFVGVSGSPAAIRIGMLRKARTRKPDVVVLVDADDVPLPAAIQSHCRALAVADLSYGDMEIIDEDGHDQGRRFFDGVDIPDSVRGPDRLSRVNFMGLTNSAISARALASFDRPLPGNVTAFDWWLFTSLLESGFAAARTDQPVTRYRHRRDATLGVRPEPSTFAKRCRMVATHARAFPHRPDLAEYGAKADHLASAVEREPQRFVAAIAAACDAPGVWFADVDRLAAGAF